MELKRKVALSTFAWAVNVNEKCHEPLRLKDVIILLAEGKHRTMRVISNILNIPQIIVAYNLFDELSSNYSPNEAIIDIKLNYVVPNMNWTLTVQCTCQIPIYLTNPVALFIMYTSW